MKKIRSALLIAVVLIALIFNSVAVFAAGNEDTEKELQPLASASEELVSEEENAEDISAEKEAAEESDADEESAEETEETAEEETSAEEETQEAAEEPGDAKAEDTSVKDEPAEDAKATASKAAEEVKSEPETTSAEAAQKAVKAQTEQTTTQPASKANEKQTTSQKTTQPSKEKTASATQSDKAADNKETKALATETAASEKASSKKATLKLLGEDTAAKTTANTNKFNPTQDGWYVYQGHKYWIQNKTKQTGWIQILNKWYYFKSNGMMKTGWHLSKSGAWYYLKKGADGGEMVTGFQTINNVRYYFNPGSGAMVQGWKKINGYWYYFKEGGSGAMQTGWQQIDGIWYYLRSNGTMKTGWHLTKAGKWYYLKKGKGAGAMVTGWQEIKGVNYYFDESGAWVETPTEEEKEKQKEQEEKQKEQSLAAKQLEACGGTLAAAYNWAVAIPYNSAQPSSSHAIDYANWSFETGSGDCIGKAAVFCFMARELGYTANLMYGYVPSARGGWIDHSWVEIVSDGTTYICDPDFQYETGRNGWFINYGQSGTWMYSNYYVHPE